MGKCCKCEEHRWEDPQEVVWEDRKTGDKYCIFHAPEDCKFLRFADEEPCTNNEFNDLVFERILNAKEKGIECELSYAILPFDISFDGPLNLPGINFYNAKFYGVVDMLAIDFSGEVNFNCAQFKSKVYLQDIDFRKGACINGVTFLDDVLISSSYFYDLVVINDTMLGSSSSIIIQGIDKLSLKEFNFDRNTLSRLRFMNCSWPDTLCFGDWEIESAAGLLFAEDLYRAMKQRAAVEHDQPLVSRWHFREKLMQLKQLLNNKRSNDLLEVVEDNEAKWWPRAWAWCKLAVLPPYWPKRSLLGLYWAFSGFGERDIRAGVWLGIFVLLSFLVSAIPQPFDWNALWGAAAANATLASIPFAKDIPGYGWVRVGRGFWQLLIAIQFTLFALAVRNRFRR